MVKEPKKDDVKKEETLKSEETLSKPEVKEEKKEDPKAEKKRKYDNPFSYKDPLQCKIVNCIMKDGKKSLDEVVCVLYWGYGLASLPAFAMLVQ